MDPLAPPVEGRHWLTGTPLNWADLRGRVVLVVFWSFGCEASLLVLRRAEDLAAAEGDDVVAIGVHTPRFPYEESADAAADAVAQHGITVHCLHDGDYEVWNRYNPDGWPATVVVDPQGRVVGAQHGTDHLEALADAVTLARPRSSTTDNQSSPLAPLPEPIVPALPGDDLAWPQDVAVRPNGQLVVADTGNDRLLLFEIDAGARQADAVAEIDGFDRPVAVVADGTDRLFVAEQGSGAVSLLDLEAQQRRLLTDQFLRPTSLTCDLDGSVVVADAGQEKLYRIVVHNPYTVTVGLIAGAGTTGTNDGDGAHAQLAQPGGLARTEAGLVFCDAASSNVRLLTDAGRVATITGNGFFDWGLVDGPAHKAKLQRPSDLAVLADGSIVVVDTGNNRLRRLAARRLRTLGLSSLRRPTAAAALFDGRLVVVDTGNQRLVVLDDDLQSAWPLTLNGVLPPRSAEERGRQADDSHP